jgi:phosphoglycerate dehydrogenase-like enzyme
MTRELISMKLIRQVKKGLILINTSRAGIVNLDAILYGLSENLLGGYLTDVLEEEPMREDHPLRQSDHVIITPHIGSRTYESVQRQGVMAVNNLLSILGKK